MFTSRTSGRTCSTRAVIFSPHWLARTAYSMGYMEKRLDVLLSMAQQRAFVQTLMSSPCQPNCRALAACARSLSEGSGGSSHPSVGNCPSSPSLGLQLWLRLQDRPLKSHQLFPQRGFSQPWSMTPFCSLKLQLRNKWVALYSHYRAKQSLEGL